MGEYFNFSSITPQLNTGSTNAGVVSMGSGYSGYTISHPASSVGVNRLSTDFTSNFSKKMNDVKLYLAAGDINAALQLYNEALPDAGVHASKYGSYDFTSSDIDTALNNAYAGNADGVGFTDSLYAKTHSPVVAGFLQGVPVLGLFAQSFSDKEVLSKVSGGKLKEVDKFSEYLGAAAAGAATGAVFGFGLPGAIIGGAVGIAQCIAKGIIDNNY